MTYPNKIPNNKVGHFKLPTLIVKQLKILGTIW